MQSWLRESRVFGTPRRGRFETLEQRLALSAAPTIINFEVGSTQWTAEFSTYLTDNSLGESGYRVPAGSSAQLKSLPWNNLDILRVTFSEDVNVAQRHMSLTGVGVANVNVAHFEYDPRAFTATWILSAALVKNSYRLEIDGDGMSPIRDLEGNSLDGTWTTSTSSYPSGNNTSGSDFGFAFRVLPGDTNQNNSVDYYDYYAATSKNGKTTQTAGYSAFVDINGSGSHTSSDSSDIYSRLSTTYPAGTPVGNADDAPSSAGRVTYSLNNANDLAITLWDDFEDNETPDSELIYELTSATNSALWSSCTIDAATGVLTLVPVTNAYGRSTFLVSAMDAAGQKVFVTYTVDVGRVNLQPTFSFEIEAVGDDTFVVWGIVDDDGPVEGLMVEFQGAITGRACVRANGMFEFTVVLPEEQWDDVDAFVVDWQNLASFSARRYAGVW